MHNPENSFTVAPRPADSLEHKSRRSPLRMIQFILIRVAVLTTITFVMLEILLGLVDPLGIRYVHQVGFMRAYYVGTPLDFRLMPGDYQLGNWQVTVNPDNTRAVPGSGTGECQAVFFGDSIAFGWGVNDADTFVSQVAAGWPAVQTRNAAVTAYNSEQIRRLIDSMEFDHGYYFIASNDADTYTQWGGAEPQAGPFVYPGIGLVWGSIPAILAYSNFLLLQGSDYRNVDMQPDYDRLIADLEHIAARGDVTFIMVNQDYPVEQTVRAHFPVIEIPPYQTRLSVADSHPDAAAHQQMAEALLPLLPHPCAA